jgi:hypothetical protein
MHGPKTASRPVGLSGMMDDDKSEGCNAQRVDEDQPLLIGDVQRISLRSHAEPRNRNEGAFTLPAGLKRALMHIKR